MKSYARILLAFAAIILATGAFLHGSAFPKIESAIASSDLAPFAGKSLKVLWLIDSITSLVIALVFVLIAKNMASALARGGGVSGVDSDHHCNFDLLFYR